MMHPKRSVKWAVSALALLALSGCGAADTPATETNAATTEANIDPVVDTPSTPESLATFKASELAEMRALLATATTTTGPGEPALWTLSDEDTTVYLFGTVHILRPDIVWRNETIDAAFQASDTVIMELDGFSSEGQLAVQQAFIGRGIAGKDGKLKDLLDDGEEAAVAAALEAVDMNINALNGLQPWMVTLTLMNLNLSKHGYDTQAGIEPILVAEAEASGKALRFLETAELQANIFASQDIDTQIKELVSSALTYAETPAILDGLVSEWADGDIVGLGALAASPEAVSSEDFYNALFVERNEAWVPQIKALLDEPGVKFVAVGSGHFAGPDSVITMLRDDGLTVVGP